jgi:signal transduction histidine kinase
VFVRDNGIGIPQKHLEAIFRMFKRLHSNEAYGGGTGAGLAVAKKIVERHDGVMWAESRVRSGTTFYFTLPTSA